MTIVGRYLLRVIFSAPLIGAGVLDAVLLVAQALGLQIDLPSWVYAAALGIGFLVANFNIFRELENTRNGSDVFVSLFRDKHYEYGDALTITQLAAHPDFRPRFGIRIATTTPGVPVKGILVELSFQWKGDPLTNALTIHQPPNDDRWQILSNHITNQKPAKFVLNGKQQVITHDLPLYITGLDFHAQEHVNGHILIRYRVTHMDSSKTNSGEVVIHLPGV